VFVKVRRFSVRPFGIGGSSQKYICGPIIGHPQTEVAFRGRGITVSDLKVARGLATAYITPETVIREGRSAARRLDPCFVPFEHRKGGRVGGEREARFPSLVKRNGEMQSVNMGFAAGNAEDVQHIRAIGVRRVENQ